MAVVVERGIPGLGSMGRAALRDAAKPMSTKEATVQPSGEERMAQRGAGCQSRARDSWVCSIVTRFAACYSSIPVPTHPATKAALLTTLAVVVNLLGVDMAAWG